MTALRCMGNARARARSSRDVEVHRDYRQPPRPAVRTSSQIPGATWAQRRDEGEMRQGWTCATAS